MLVIVKRKITVHIKEATKGYMAAIVSRLQQLCICLLLSVFCYIVLSESIKTKLPPWLYYQTLLKVCVVSNIKNAKAGKEAELIMSQS